MEFFSFFSFFTCDFSFGGLKFAGKDRGFSPKKSGKDLKNHMGEWVEGCTLYKEGYNKIINQLWASAFRPCGSHVTWGCQLTYIDQGMRGYGGIIYNYFLVNSS